MKKIEVLSHIASWTWLTVGFHWLNALLAVALPTAGGLVGLSENLPTDWTLPLNSIINFRGSHFVASHTEIKLPIILVEARHHYNILYITFQLPFIDSCNYVAGNHALYRKSRTHMYMIPSQDYSKGVDKWGLRGLKRGPPPPPPPPRFLVKQIIQYGRDKKKKRPKFC